MTRELEVWERFGTNLQKDIKLRDESGTTVATLIVDDPEMIKRLELGTRVRLTFEVLDGE